MCPIAIGERYLGGGATHAWCQVYLPGAGWIEFDPTNGIVGNRDLIRVAVARDARQAIPLHGSYFGSVGDGAGHGRFGPGASASRPGTFRRRASLRPSSPPPDARGMDLASRLTRAIRLRRRQPGKLPDAHPRRLRHRLPVSRADFDAAPAQRASLARRRPPFARRRPLRPESRDGRLSRSFRQSRHPRRGPAGPRDLLQPLRHPRLRRARRDARRCAGHADRPAARRGADVPHREPLLRQRQSHRFRLVDVRRDHRRLPAGQGDLRLRPRQDPVQLSRRALHRSASDAMREGSGSAATSPISRSRCAAA